MLRDIVPIPIQTIIGRTMSEGCTQSEITTFDNCAMLWLWRYGMLLRRKGSMSWASIYGTAAHSTWEQMYATKGQRWSPAALKIPADVVMTVERQKQKEYWEGVLDVQMRKYAEYYKDDFTLWNIKDIEVDVDVVFEGLRLRGKIDLTFTEHDGRFWLLDFKTTSRLDLPTVLGWDFRFQFMFYLWLATLQLKDVKFAGYYINALKKPSIKVKQNEALPTYLGRLEGEMGAEPDKYYYRSRLLLTSTSLSYFESNVLRPKLERIKLLTNPNISDTVKESLCGNMNTDHCQRYGACEFLPLCEHGYDLESFQYEERRAKHEELEEE